MVDAIIWWITLQILGLIAIPVAAVLLRALPDRGYSASKALGWLLTGWLAYTLSMVQVLPFERWSIALCALLLAGLSGWLLYRNGRVLLTELGAHFRLRSTIKYVVTAEVLFGVLFTIWAIVRAYNPGIVDQEKFMDFGFLNSILKSGTFPPHDMWLAGYSINYYYFGYVLVAALTSLSGVPSQVAFNLANVTLFSLTALGAFGVLWNLAQSTRLREFGIARRKTERKGEQAQARKPKAAQAVVAASTVPTRKSATAPVAAPTQPATAPGALPSRRTRKGQPTEVLAPPASTATATLEETQTLTVAGDGNGSAAGNGVPRTPRPRPTEAYLPAQDEREPRHIPWFLSPYIYAVLAALMVVAMGNLTVGFAQRQEGVGDQAGAPMPDGGGYRFCLFCNAGTGYDWFSPSRIIRDYRTDASGQKLQVGFQTINEFPAFSFLLADMHPHVLALPLVLLALAVAQAFARRRVLRATSWRDGIPPGLAAWLSLVVVGIIVGSLYTANTWDYPTYLLVVVAALILPYLAAQRRSDNPRGWRWALPWLVQAILVVALSLVVFIPFHLTFKSLVGGQPATVPENLASIPVLGWVLQKLATLVLINTADKTILGFVVIFGIFLVSLLGWLLYELVSFVRKQMDAAYDEERTSYAPYVWMGGFVLVLLFAILFRFPLFALLVPVAVISLYLAWQEPGKAERNTALIMTAVAALISLVIELVFLRDNFQMRMNTLFKFYFQVWVLWALAAAYGMWRVLYGAFSEREERAERGQTIVYTAPAWSKALAGVWAVFFAFLVLTGLNYSIIGPMSRQGILTPNGSMKGLDGSTWIRDTAPGDYDAINWLKNNGTGNERVLEAGSDEYRWPGRVSAYSGVATLIAWDNSHEALWRTNQPDAAAQIGERRRVVNAIYQGTDPNGGGQLDAQKLLDLLHQYKVTYVFAGATERGQGNWAPGNGSEKMSSYAEGLFNQALPVAYRSGTTVVYRVGQGIEGTGQAPTGSATQQSGPPATLFEMSLTGNGPGHFDLPRGIARDARGDFFVVDTQNERIQKFDETGKWVSSFGSKGSGDGQFAALNADATGTGPGGVAVDSQGNVYVADTWNHRIQKFSNDGKFLAKWGSFVNIADPNSVNGQNRDAGFYGPRGVAIGPDGNLYVTDTGNKRVMVFDTSGKFVRKIDSGLTKEKIDSQYPFNQPGEMNEPIGIAVDKSGNVYVADTNNRRIQKFDNTGKFAAQWAVPQGAWDPGPYLEPFMAVDASGNLYVTEPMGKNVLKYSPDGKLLGQSKGTADRTLALPTGIAVANDGTIYVVDTGSNGVVNLGKIQ